MRMTVSELNINFGLPGILQFDEHQGLTRAQVTLPTATATVYLHGAHLTHWQPTGQAPVLFLSETSEFAAGKPIRGGIPVCFPWFGARKDGKPGPSHGFARLQDWELAFAALVPGESETLHLTFTLGPSDLSVSLGFDHFRVAYEMILGKTLTLRLSVANLGNEPLVFEEALHTYFAVSDVHKCSVTGLESAKFLDKTDGFKEKTGPAGALVLTGQTDRVYPGHTGTAVVHDAGDGRDLTVEKTHSATTIVWNPWDEVKFPDLPDDAWPGFLCVETANSGAGALTLELRGAHTMEAVIGVK